MKNYTYWLTIILIFTMSNMVIFADDTDDLLGYIPITDNADWTPIEQDFDGVPMVLVPAGCFMMGNDSDNSRDEYPAHVQCFDTPFWIDKYEVTQAQFEQFGGEKANSNAYNGDDRPVERITWYEARAFCDLRGVRLPTEAEWEYAARGPSNWIYPWGDEFDPNNAVFLGNSRGQTADVGSFPEGASWVGALDMAGNVWEFTSSIYLVYPYVYEDADGEGVLEDMFGKTFARRGGAWLNEPDSVRSDIRNASAPVSFISYIGFRCARFVDDMPEATNTSQSGFTSITRNEDWTPVEQDFDGVPMVLVPAGCFMMGSSDISNAQRVHEQCFDAPFWIDKYEVTQAQFRQFNGQKANPNEFTGDDLPVERITWFEARDFCALRDGRLPTEREWEYAARGPNNLMYPWGNEFVADNLVYWDNSNRRTAPVGSREGGVSWIGAMDMSGNVWEWMSSLYLPYPYSDRSEQVNVNVNTNVTRGGSWFNTTSFVSSPYRNSTSPSFEDSSIGLRCVRSQE